MLTKKTMLAIALGLSATSVLAAPSIVELAGGKHAPFRSEISDPPGSPPLAHPASADNNANGNGPMPGSTTAKAPAPSSMPAAATPSGPSAQATTVAASQSAPSVTPSAAMTSSPALVSGRATPSSPQSVAVNTGSTPNHGGVTLPVDPFSGNTSQYGDAMMRAKNFAAEKQAMQELVEYLKLRTQASLIPLQTQMQTLKLKKDIDQLSGAVAPPPAPPVMPVTVTKPKTASTKRKKRSWKPNIRYLGYVEGDGKKMAYLKVGSRYHQVHVGERAGRYTVSAISDDQVSVKYKGRTYRFDRTQKDYRIEARGTVMASNGAASGLGALRQMLGTQSLPAEAGQGIQGATGMMPGAPGVSGMPGS